MLLQLARILVSLLDTRQKENRKTSVTVGRAGIVQANGICEDKDNGGGGGSEDGRGNRGGGA